MAVATSTIARATIDRRHSKKSRLYAGTSLALQQRRDEKIIPLADLKLS